MFWALAEVLDRDRRSSLAVLARRRLGELIEQGQRSLLAPGLGKAELGSATYSKGHWMPTREREVHTYFDEARRSAERWRAEREAFLLAKLRAGKHPDTDADFWKGYDPGVAPALPGSGYFGLESVVQAYPILSFLAVAAGAIPSLWLVARAVRRRIA